MAKKELTISEFREIIKEEALKLKKRMVLENEKKALMSELKTINESYAEGYQENPSMSPDNEVDESWIGDRLGTSDKSKREKLQKDFMMFAKIWKKKGVIKGMNQEMLNALMMQAAEDGYAGKPGYDKETGLMTYRGGDDINWSGLGLNRGGSFGGTGAGE